jgi:hypothetical protein
MKTKRYTTGDFRRIGLTKKEYIKQNKSQMKLVMIAWGGLGVFCCLMGLKNQMGFVLGGLALFLTFILFIFYELEYYKKIQ